MSKTVDYFLKLPYSVHIVPDKYPSGAACYFARVAELPGCESHGDTPEDAEMSLRDAMAEYISSLIEDGLEPPEPVRHGVSVVWRSNPTIQVPVAGANTASPYSSMRLQPA